MKSLLLILNQLKGAVLLSLAFSSIVALTASDMDEGGGRLGNVEYTVIESQKLRLDSASENAFVFLGDSTALNDIDARLLQDSLDQKVTSVAVMAACGVETIAHQLSVILDQVRTSTSDHRPHIIITVNPISFERFDFNLSNFAQQSESDDAARLSVQRRIRYSVRSLIGRVIAWPLPGSFGVVYGDPSGLRYSITQGNGTFDDPNPPLHDVQLTASENKDLSSIGNTEHQLLTKIDRKTISELRRLGCTVELLVTPIPLEMSTRPILARIHALSDNAVHDLYLDGWVAMPWQMSGQLFSNQHLSPEGRATYNNALAIELKQRYSLNP